MRMLGTFLCISANRQPEVHALAPLALDAFNARLALASKRGTVTAREGAYRFAFGFAFDAAIPCWSVEAMERIATEYEGPHQQLVRFYAAAIALGETYGADRHEGQSPPEGGLKVQADDAKPKPRKPSGGATVSPFAGLAVAS